ncbi:hypothetical protein, conserved [Eimeria tenella]|uniref:Methionyl-tRNA synthetase anticodon-binding domain-containing protein n=1 Tax=Eimeria tenella TaxID=5802 RepID=U6L832_EIMTE|nr:hypothetical protein, conserved [Eimeria tenella]CDJ44734.1 hypothetical protein, conserved [Eimeria tenella]|eukprot:XP_013235482.1 hypothetical protein, conserved [Eimeria tenella]
MAGGGAPLDVEALRRTVEKAFAAVALREALEAVLLGVRELNKFVTSAAPWSCQEEERRQEVVRVGLECMYTLAHFLEPFLPQAMALLFQQLNAKPKLLQQLSPWLENLEPGTELKPADRVLFALLQLPDEQQQQQGERQQQQGEQQHQQGERDSSSSKASQTTSDTPTSRRDAGL